MPIVNDLKEKPIESASAIALIVLGISAGFLKESWAAPVGTAAAALGGALLSYATASLNLRVKAAKQLEPELQSMARHLADTAAKLSRAIQTFQQGETDAEITIDRIAQLISSIYASLNDIHVIAGSTTNFQTLVETVRGCEDMAARLEELTTRAGGSSAEVEELRQRLESARLQLDSARKSFGDLPGERREEQPRCPACDKPVTVQLGLHPGATVVGSCPDCLIRFNVHRAADGTVFARSGLAPNRKPLDVTCPACSARVRVNFDLAKSLEKRFCMRCCSELTVLPSGEVTAHVPMVPVDTETIGFSGGRQILRCPKCAGSITSLWANADIARAVCSDCGVLLQAPRQIKDGASAA